MTVKELYMHFTIPKVGYRCDDIIQIYDRKTCETENEILPIISTIKGKTTLPKIICRYAERTVFEWCVKARDKNCFSLIIIVD